MAIIAIIKKPDSIYKNKPDEQNTMEGKKVWFVANKDEKENADGASGHLEAIGTVDYKPSIYEKVYKRLIDIVLSFFGLVVLSPLFLVLT